MPSLFAASATQREERLRGMKRKALSYSWEKGKIDDSKMHGSLLIYTFHMHC
jgi:hypothetical protein